MIIRAGCLISLTLGIALASADIDRVQTGLSSFFLHPPGASVGSEPGPLRVYSQSVISGMVARWNGRDRPTRTLGQNEVEIDLTKEDLEQPGLAEITLYDPRTEILVPGQAQFPIGYGVAPKGVLYDTQRKRFYLTTPADSKDPLFPPNSLIWIDPERKTLGTPLSPGPSPGLMALSDDGKALYVVIEGNGTVQRIDPDLWASVSEFHFRSKGGFYGGEMTGIAVMPGNSDTVALSYHPDPASSAGEIAMFDNGVKRARTAADYASRNALVFSPDGSRLFVGSFCSTNCNSAISRYSVDGGGIASTKPDQIQGYAPVTIRDGVLFTAGGTIVDIESLAILGNLGIAGGMAVDFERSRILVVNLLSTTNSDYPEFVQAFDLATLYPLGSHQVGAVHYFGTPAYKLHRWGSDGLAYGSQTMFYVFRTPLAGPAPHTTAEAVVNSASGRTGAIAPGEIVSIYGQNLGPEQPRSPLFDRHGHLPASLGHVQVWFDQTPGTVIYASAGQLNVVAPFNIEPGKRVLMQVWNYGIPSAQIPLEVVAAAPGIYTQGSSGSGPASVVVYPGGSLNTAVAPDDIVALFATGGGPTPRSADGSLAWAAEELINSVAVFVGSKRAEVLYAGACPSLVHGIFQVNIRIPDGTPPGSQPVRLEIAGQDSPSGVSIAIR